MNFSGSADTPQSLSRNRRRPFSGACSRRRGLCSPPTYLLHQKSESDRRHIPVCSYTGGGAGIRDFPEVYRRAEVSGRKLVAGLWKSPFGARGGSFDQLNNWTESATKWDCRRSERTSKSYHLYDPKKLPEDKVKAISSVSTLQAELLKAPLDIHELEPKRVSSKKKIKHLVGKLEHLKECDILSIIGYLLHKLGEERKERLRIEAVNSKLLDELAESKLFMNQIMKDYKEKKRERDLIGETCQELVRKIETLKGKMMKIKAEVEDEKQMLQMAEVWREERVKMKLIDAKLVLEDKFHEMNKLVNELEMFLRSRSDEIGEMGLRKAEFLRRVVKSLNIHDLEELEYVVPEPGDIYSIVEGIRGTEDGGRDIEECVYGNVAISQKNTNIQSV